MDQPGQGGSCIVVRVPCCEADVRLDNLTSFLARLNFFARCLTVVELSHGALQVQSQDVADGCSPLPVGAPKFSAVERREFLYDNGE